MKKIIGLALALFCCETMAEFNPYLSYVGFEIGQIYTGFSATRNTINQYRNPYAHFYLGHNLVDFVSFEYGAFTTQSANSSTDKREGQSKVHGVHGGFIFPIRLPLFPNFEILPGAGMCFAMSHVYKPRVIDIHQNGLIPRFSLGAQYKCTDRIKIKTSFVWHSFNGFFSDNINMRDVMKFGIGINYSFQPM